MKKKLYKKNHVKEWFKAFYRIITIILLLRYFPDIYIEKNYESLENHFKIYYTILMIIPFDTFFLEIIIIFLKVLV